MEYIAKVLADELKKRQEINPAYSLRSFAKMLGISPATLSQVISEKRPLGRKSQEKVLNKLGIKAESPISPQFIKVSQSLKLEEDIFSLISRWHYFAILSLSEVKGSLAAPSWIASQLGISIQQANQAMTRLKRMGIIEIQDDGSYKQVCPPLTTTDEIPSTAIQNFHKGILDLAKLKIEQTSVEKREFRSITMAANSKNIR